MSRLLLALFFLNLLGCGGSSGGGGASIDSTVYGGTDSLSLPATTLSASSSTTYNNLNRLSVSVGCYYANEPCVSVTICVPGTNNCQTINNILLDTGSQGLRLMNSVVTLPLSILQDSNGRDIAECVTYADNSSTAGYLSTVDIQIGSEKASSRPIQLVGSITSGLPDDCSDPVTTPSALGANGILGVSIDPYDCGMGECSNPEYMICSGGACVLATSHVALSYQLINPIIFMTQDNNGYVFTMGSVAATGAASATGTLTMGLGTQANNAVSGSPTVLPAAEENPTLISILNSTAISNTVLDSGTNSLYFPSSVFSKSSPSYPTACTSSSLSGFYCPTSPISYSFTLEGDSGTPSTSQNFTIMNPNNMLGNGVAFPELGGDSNDSNFMLLGLPFFYGKTLYFGIDGRTTSLGSGPFNAL